MNLQKICNNLIKQNINITSVINNNKNTKNK